MSIAASQGWSHSPPPGENRRRQRAGQAGQRGRQRAEPHRGSAIPPAVTAPASAARTRREGPSPEAESVRVPLPSSPRSGVGMPFGSCPRPGNVARCGEQRALCGGLSTASSGAFRPLWYAEKWVRCAAAVAVGRNGARRDGKPERRVERKNRPRCPPRLSASALNWAKQEPASQLPRRRGVRSADRDAAW